MRTSSTIQSVWSRLPEVRKASAEEKRAHWYPADSRSMLRESRNGSSSSTTPISETEFIATQIVVHEIGKDNHTSVSLRRYHGLRLAHRRAQSPGHSGQFGYGPGLHFLHHMTPLHLDRYFAGSELSRDLLVQQSLDHKLHDFVLP